MTFQLILPKIGKTYRWDYPVEFTEKPEYTAHSGHSVIVLRQLSENEADPVWDDPDDTGEPVIVDLMFWVRASDGFEGAAWASELEVALS